MQTTTLVSNDFAYRRFRAALTFIGEYSRPQSATNHFFIARSNYIFGSIRNYVHYRDSSFNLCSQTFELKEALAKAKELANSLPGGELMLEEQDELIRLLESVRDHKR